MHEQRKQVQNLMEQNNKYVTQKTVRAAHQELDQLGNTLGSAYKELHPLQRDAIEGRAQQLRELVRTQDPDQDLEAGRRRQRAYMRENAVQAARARERQFVREQVPSRSQSMYGDADQTYVPAHIRAGHGPLVRGRCPTASRCGVP